MNSFTLLYTSIYRNARYWLVIRAISFFLFFFSCFGGEIAKSFLTQLFKLVKGIWTPTNCCDTVYSMGNIVNPFMLHKPPCSEIRLKVRALGYTKIEKKLLFYCAFPCDIKSCARRPLCSAALKFWFVKAGFKQRYITQSCACPNVRLYQDCCSWCGLDSFVPLCRRHRCSAGSFPFTALLTVLFDTQTATNNYFYYLWMYWSIFIIFFL